MTKNLNPQNMIANLTQEAHYFAEQNGFTSYTNHNDEVDAFRHIYASAFIAFKYGRLSQSIVGYLHETMTNNPEREAVMDFHNNKM